MSFARNNLDLANSPYLRQHAENPVWWQEWSAEILEYARKTDRIVFVSVGYSTCHWCHVMAREAFSDETCASILNRHFVPVKVDREQRPDIDHYLMSFLVATTGSGGWPLNAFLTPEGHPFFAMTYASTEPRFHLPAFDDILGRVREFFGENRDRIAPFELNAEHSGVDGAIRKVLAHDDGGEAEAGDGPAVAMISDEDESQAIERVDELDRAFDRVHAGFGQSQKFPPHSALLYLQHACAAGLSERAGEMARETLDAMMTRGLHDHLQGGFFRYTVDREWTIPHFEKMLYDQAMLLWNYAVASRLFGSRGYRETAAGIVRALEETFREGPGYASAHDADTNHREGGTYIWKLEEIEEILEEAELDAFLRVFAVSRDGNFERRNHLVRILPPGVHDDEPSRVRHGPDRAVLDRAVERLLEARRRRDQPERDDKTVAGWNALAGCGLLAAHRFARIEGTLERAHELAAFLVERFVTDGPVAHSALGDALQRQEFLGDAGALLLFLTMLAEEGEAYDTPFRAAREHLRARLAALERDGVWMESLPNDFPAVPAEPFDQPVPSGIALAEYALLLDRVRSHGEYAPIEFADAHAQAFANLTALASRGYLYVVESPQPVSWDELPLHSVQVRGEARTSCYRGVCYLGLPPADARAAEKRRV